MVVAVQARYERMAAELQKLREANGHAGLPDFEAEEALRDALVATEEQKRQVLPLYRLHSPAPVHLPIPSHFCLGM